MAASQQRGYFVPRTLFSFLSKFLCVLLICDLLFATTTDAQTLHGRAQNGTTASDGQSIVAVAQEAMAHANTLILKHPRLNHYRTQTPEDKAAAKKDADPLLLSDFVSNETTTRSSSLLRRAGASSNSNSEADSATQDEAKSYTIPKAVAQAAADIATSDSPGAAAAAADSYDSLIVTLRAKYKPKTNDTNRMPQRLETYSGLLAGIVAPGEGFEMATTDVTTTTHIDDTADPTIKLRQRSSEDNDGTTSTFWMETIHHNRPKTGATFPGAPEGYTVFRNVKDYGAVGDGVTDDTQAIKKAITDNRDSSGLPATVYFPSGTYLLSSPIIHPAHTEMVGNPLSLPRLVAAKSFVGFGLITSEVFVQQDSAWFIDSDSQLRSIRNLVVDIRAAKADAYVTGVHWQAGRGCSLENVQFYMSEEEDTTQMGMFVENGRGGALSNLFFIGGRVGMLVAQQQFAASGLYFTRCKTAVRMLWDWGLSMQNLVVTDCGTGLDLVEEFDIGQPPIPTSLSNGTLGGGITNGTSSIVARTAQSLRKMAGRRSSRPSSLWKWPSRLSSRQNNNNSASGPNGNDDASFPKSQAGSFSLVDMYFSNTPVAINASLSSDLTSLLVLNSAFSDVGTAIRNSHSGRDLLPGSTNAVDAWAYGKVYDSSTSSFKTARGEILPNLSPSRNISLTVPSDDARKPLFFHRARPSYASIDHHATQIINVQDFGAKGDGKSDDTGILNTVLDMAANLSAVAFFPYGEYLISDTLNIPVGSRIVGESWAKIVAASDREFGQVKKPRAAVMIGRRVPGLVGDVGVVEIQGLTFTTRGQANGGVLVEWNARQPEGEPGEVHGAVGMWDTQFRTGSDDGSAAALMLHLRPGSSAYLDNVGLGSDAASGGMSGRALLVESQGPSWLWGVSSANNAVYQYGFSSAENLVAGQLIMSTTAVSSSLGDMALAQKMVNTAPFSGDPTPDSNTTLSAVRFANSHGIHILSAGDLDTASTLTMFDVDSLSQSVTIHNANNFWHTGNDEGSSPIITFPPTQESSNITRRRAADSIDNNDNNNGKTTSILSATDIKTTAAAAVTYDPFYLWKAADLDGTNATDSCKALLTSTAIACPNTTLEWSTQPMYHGSRNNTSLTAAICASTCRASLARFITQAQSVCAGFVFPSSGMAPTLPAYYTLQGVSETCATDPGGSGKYCNDIIDKFSASPNLDAMPKSELCHPCYTSRLRTMQSSPYSIYRLASFYQRALKKAISTCPLDSSIPTAPQPAPIPSQPDTSGNTICVSDTRYKTKAGDNCNSIALAQGVSSAGLLNANKKSYPSITNCTAITPGMDLCLPLKCTTYSLKDNDTCSDVAYAHGLATDDILRYNSWIEPTSCSNLVSARPLVGRVICLSPPGGEFIPPPPSTNGTTPGGGGGGGGSGTGQNAGGTGYSTVLAPPPSGAAVASRTTRNCGVWHVATKGDTCEGMMLSQGLARQLLLETNPTLRGDCTAKLVAGTAYCVSPLQTWDTKVSFPYREVACYGLAPNSNGTKVLWGNYERDDAGMTVQRCAESCLLVGYRFFGLMNGDGCWCDDVIQIGSKATTKDKCPLVCVGNSTQSCGGTEASGYMNVWSGW